MWPKEIILLCLAFVIVKSEYVVKDEKLRKPRLFSFNTLDEDLAVNLEFSVPFISIPIKKAMQSMFGSSPSGLLPSINVNLASLALGGAVVLGSTVLLPLLLKKQALHNPYRQYARFIDNTEFGVDAMVHSFNHILEESQTFSGCAERIACWGAQRSSATKSAKIWSQIFSNRLLSSVINSTAIEEAMSSGRKGHDCEFYSPCPLREDHMPILISNLAVLTNSSSY